MKPAITTSPGFDEIAAYCAQFRITDFSNPARVEDYVQTFGLREVCQPVKDDSLASHNTDLLRSVSANETKPFGPNFDDLSRLHWLCLSRKVVNVLEFGSGYSTVVLAHAAQILHRYFGDWAIQNIRAEKPFHIFSVEEDARFVDITKQRLVDYSSYATVSHSGVKLIEYEGRFATLYHTLPNISPDFIYLDGPSQYATLENIDGFSIATRARMPMSADVLRFEFFLEPGTLLLTDGRTANARFLKAHFKRHWVHMHDKDGDVHYFELQEPPLGRFNNRKLEFCLNNEWLLVDQ